MLKKLVIFGGTGDLAHRFLFPGLSHLHAAGKLPDRFQIYAAAHESMSENALRQSVSASLEENAGRIDAGSREAIVDALRYQEADVAQPNDVRTVMRRAAGETRDAVGVYLALPPSLFDDAVEALGDVLTPGSRIG